MTFVKLSAEDVIARDIVGRPFLHEQGQFVCRGYVADFTVEGDYWTLKVRDVECLDKMAGQWRHDTDADEYGGSLSQYCSFVEDTIDDIICLSGYGMEINVGPECDSPWSEIDWPELDGYEGGPMTGRLSKRDKKKRRKKGR
ncbi:MULTISPECIES: hypothetical protein [Kordiimonas]|jgi:hypothetical protein|uniref:hypothetical protein n=1 Tax=Kordiimonas TaxID=288021 RepID=UPI00257A4BBA|nr:hypothetical protein [Kordiimonas sp. UBA4487]